MKFIKLGSQVEVYMPKHNRTKSGIVVDFFEPEHRITTEQQKQYNITPNVGVSTWKRWVVQTGPENFLVFPHNKDMVSREGSLKLNGGVIITRIRPTR